MSDVKELTLAEVAAHTTKKDLYMVIHDKVYDATSFIDEHPYVPPIYPALPKYLTILAKGLRRVSLPCRESLPLSQSLLASLSSSEPPHAIPTPYPTTNETNG